MSEWATKRFWKDATVETVADGFAIRLDGRPVRTPAKTELVVPSRTLAEGIAEEWRAQGERVDPMTMPLTRAANAALDKVVPQHAEVASNLAEYGGSDLICYRAPGPEGLVARQVAAWDPLVAKAAERFGAELRVTQGIVPVPQSPTALDALRARVAAMDAWELTALSEFVSLSGSLIIGLAAMEGDPPEPLWQASRVDEDWQAEQWGVDEAEAGRVDAKRAAFFQAHCFLTALRAG
ncbi:ATPase [Jannaschia sp. S6380]|uniref:ATP12 family chaperone protein n=1 Tax=Jannaschia sp. S6380 TaxID=2926408 RepID=UPI001FF5FC19|nr:ATP12 family protein [Jannaschia sp. S6380]MCK0165964.1 ATPase [Jannaschia sp. S6380]